MNIISKQIPHFDKIFIRMGILFSVNKGNMCHSNNRNNKYKHRKGLLRRN